MYTLYSSRDKVHFDWEAEEATLPTIVIELGKWLTIRAMSIDPAVAKESRQPKNMVLHYYIFEGSNNIDGKLIGEASITIKRFENEIPVRSNSL